MPLQTTVQLPSGEVGIVIYPNSKNIDRTVFQATYGNVVVHYLPPDQPDIADPMQGGTSIFIVPQAAIELGNQAMATGNR